MKQSKCTELQIEFGIKQFKTVTHLSEVCRKMDIISGAPFATRRKILLSRYLKTEKTQKFGRGECSGQKAFSRFKF